MQKYYWDAVRIARLLPVKAVAVANIQHTASVGLYGGVQVGVFLNGVHGDKHRSWQDKEQQLGQIGLLKVKLILEKLIHSGKHLSKYG